MTEIPKEAHTLAFDLATQERIETSLQLQAHHYTNAFARFIADVNEKAKKVDAGLDEIGLDAGVRERVLVQSLILPNPEDDLRQEAREICARDAEEQGCPDVADRYRTGVSDSAMPMRCTLAALRKGRE